MMIPLMYVPSVDKKNISWPGFKGVRSFVLCLL